MIHRFGLMMELLRTRVFLSQLLSLFFFIHLFICAKIICAISPPDPNTLPLPSIPFIPGRTCSALFSNFVEE
jgi:hypothetical protein